jgi:hypothetical protein
MVFVLSFVLLMVGNFLGIVRLQDFLINLCAGGFLAFILYISIDLNAERKDIENRSILKEEFNKKFDATLNAISKRNIADSLADLEISGASGALAFIGKSSSIQKRIVEHDNDIQIIMKDGYNFFLNNREILAKRIVDGKRTTVFLQATGAALFEDYEKKDSSDNYPNSLAERIETLDPLERRQRWDCIASLRVIENLNMRGTPETQITVKIFSGVTRFAGVVSSERAFLSFYPISPNERDMLQIYFPSVGAIHEFMRRDLDNTAHTSKAFGRLSEADENWFIKHHGEYIRDGARPRIADRNWGKNEDN